MSEMGIVDRDSIPLKELHREISKIINAQKEKAKEIIEKHKEDLNLIIDYLMENEKIDGETFRRFLKDLKNFKAA
jgi:ATP-dependent Zn protease